MLFLLVFSAIGRFSHGLPVFEVETFRTADPFIAGRLSGVFCFKGEGTCVFGSEEEFIK